MQFAFFETALRAQKSYSRLMEPVCKKWDLTHNELDVLLFLANNPEQNRAADEFYEYLLSDEAKEVFKSYYFDTDVER